MQGSIPYSSFYTFATRIFNKSLAQLEAILILLNIKYYNIYSTPENQANKDKKSQYSLTQNQIGK